MNIKILGTGCAKCHALDKAVKEVVEQLQIDATVEEVKDINRIIEYPVLTMPGLVIDEQVICYGQVPTKEKIVQMITNALHLEKHGKVQ